MNFGCWCLFASLWGSSEVGGCWFSCPSSIGEDQFETCLGHPVYRWPITLPSGEKDFSIYFVSEVIYNPQSPLLFPSLRMFVYPSIEKLFYLRFLLLNPKVCVIWVLPLKAGLVWGWHCSETSVTHRSPCAVSSLLSLIQAPFRAWNELSSFPLSAE